MIKGFKIGDKILVTTDQFFFAPDGAQYRAVWGSLVAIESDESTLGIKTNSKSTNWYVQIGSMLIAGCQVHYAVKCDDCDTHREEYDLEYEGQIRVVNRKSRIFNADGAAEE